MLLKACKIQYELIILADFLFFYYYSGSSCIFEKKDIFSSLKHTLNTANVLKKKYFYKLLRQRKADY